jgi:hypothetical protein
MATGKQNISKPEGRKGIGPLTALMRIVTIAGELNEDHLKLHLISELGKKMEKEWNRRIRRSQEEMKELLWFYMYIKKRHSEKTIWEHMNYGEGNKVNYGEGNKLNYGEGNKVNYGEGNKVNYGEGNKVNYGEGNKMNYGEGNKMTRKI